MYSYVEDKQFVSRMRNLCGRIMQECCHIFKEEYDIGANFYLVGSGAKNLIMQNERNPIDLDYNLEVVRCEDFRDCRRIKEDVRKAFNSALHEFGWRDCQDSTSSLTTAKYHFTQGNQTEFSMDVCIVCRDVENKYYRLIHRKIGCIDFGDYYWNLAPESKQLKRKVDSIKRKGKWELVRIEYKKLKNKYLQCNDHNHPSFICYVEVVNNIYNSCNQ